MRAGTPLTDVDRMPWLRTIRDWISAAGRRRGGDLLRPPPDLPRRVVRGRRPRAVRPPARNPGAAQTADGGAPGTLHAVDPAGLSARDARASAVRRGRCRRSPSTETRPRSWTPPLPRWTCLVEDVSPARPARPRTGGARPELAGRAPRYARSSLPGRRPCRRRGSRSSSPPTPANLYQFEQWRRPLEELADRIGVFVDRRSARTLGAAVQVASRLPVTFARGSAALERAGVRPRRPGGALPEPGRAQLPDAAVRRPVHVQIGHGESDKGGSVSNQHKAYDVTLVGWRGRPGSAGDVAGFRRRDTDPADRSSAAGLRLSRRSGVAPPTPGRGSSTHRRGRGTGRASRTDRWRPTVWR